MAQEYPFHLLLSFMAKNANAGSVKKWCEGFLGLVAHPPALQGAKDSMDEQWTKEYMDRLREAFEMADPGLVSSDPQARRVTYWEVLQNPGYRNEKVLKQFGESDMKSADSYAAWERSISAVSVGVVQRKSDLVTLGDKTYVLGPEVMLTTAEEYRAEVVKRGLAKLTEEEKEAMGLLAFKFEE